MLRFSQAFLVYVLLMFSAPLVKAQDIRIRVLNGRNGKPINNECLNVWIGRVHGSSLLAPTNEDGVALLHIADNRVTAENVPHPGCVRLLAISPKALPYDANEIVLTGDQYVDCQESEEVRTSGRLEGFVHPSYPIKKILGSGIAAANMCGNVRVEPKPGELIFFVRPRTFWERMKE